MRVKCLSCDAVNDAVATGGFCENCGKKLPAAALIRPRRTLGDGTTDGPDEAVLRSRAGASEALYVAAVVHLVAGGLFLILGPALFRVVPDRFAPHVVFWTVAPSVVVAVLGWLARSQSRPIVLAAPVLLAGWVAATFLIEPVLAQAWL